MGKCADYGSKGSPFQLRTLIQLTDLCWCKNTLTGFVVKPSQNMVQKLGKIFLSRHFMISWVLFQTYFFFKVKYSVNFFFAKLRKVKKASFLPHIGDPETAGLRSHFAHIWAPRQQGLCSHFAYMWAPFPTPIGTLKMAGVM